MRILIAPDSFKGSLTAQQATEAIESGVRSVRNKQQTDILRCPMADGGEGSLRVITDIWKVPVQRSHTEDPLGRPHCASWALSADGNEAVIEIAEASGLPLVKDLHPQVLEANTKGTGILIAEALSRGARSITLCLGGSATVDGGIGILSVLGVRFYDRAGSELRPIPRNLTAIASIDLSSLTDQATQATWQLLVDVTNPLTGVQGAAAVFGPQKGADAAQVQHLDRGLENLARLLSEVSNTDLMHRQSFGAAGGVPVGLYALFGAKVSSGSEWLGELVDLPNLVSQADVIFTGEGRIDGQSGSGKVVSYIAQLAAKVAVAPPVVCFAGQIDCPPSQLHQMGIAAAFSISTGSQSAEELMESAAPLLHNVVANVTSLLGHGELLTNSSVSPLP